MAVVAPQGDQTGAAGTGSPRAPIGVPTAATTVASTNPNNFPVYVTVSTSAATVTVIAVNGVTVPGVTATTTVPATVLVPGSGTITCTYASGAITYKTYSTGLPAANDYPFTDPVFQNFTVQQYLTVAGVNASGTYA